MIHPSWVGWEFWGGDSAVQLRPFSGGWTIIHQLGCAFLFSFFPQFSFDRVTPQEKVGPEVGPEVGPRGNVGYPRFWDPKWDLSGTESR